MKQNYGTKTIKNKITDGTQLRFWELLKVFILRK
jgi:hypothetical protein